MKFNRRTVITAAAASAAAPLLGDSAKALAAGLASPAPVAATDLTATYVRFARTLSYEDLPATVVRAAKRYLIDSTGCILAGWQSEKGQLAARTMRSFGGQAEASILGSNGRVPAPQAAFANAELMNGLDYDAIPHIPPVTLPTLLALAEKTGASGRDLIRATVVAHEIAARLGSASSQMSASIQGEGKTPDVFGINCEAIIATAAAAAALLRLDDAQTASAMGLAGYYAPPQVAHDWETGTPKSHVKYTPVGWVCQGATTAALLAQAGFTGNPTVLDGPAAFPVFYGFRKWDDQAARRGLGQLWRIETVDFKPYASCRYTHSQVDCLVAVLRKHQIRPQEIEAIHASGPPFDANPRPMDVLTQEDAQFSTPYVLAIIASGRQLDASCQSAALRKDPDLRRMMQKIRWDTLPADPKHPHAARVEVTARGQRFVETTTEASGTASVGRAMSDGELDSKFLQNAGTILTADAARKSLELLWKCDELPQASQMLDLMRT